MSQVLELVRKALDSGNPEAIKLAHSLAKNPGSYKDDPVGYCKAILGVTLWEKQREIAEALVKHRRVMVRSCNAAGKSFTVACLASWFHQAFVPGICAVTAPTDRQVRDVTFKEIRKLYKGPGLFPKNPRIQQTPEHYCYGFTADTADAYQGIHGPNLFVIFEECTGVASEFWEAANGVLAGGENTYWLAVCNPTDTTSQAYQEEQSGRWHVISISAFDHPNIALELAGEPPLIPGAIRLKELRELIGQWCDPVAQDFLPTDFEFEGKMYRPGPIAEARLLGRYPTQGSYSIFNDFDFARSLAAQVPEGEIEIGCDVARFGDDNTVIHVKQGNVSLFHESYNKRDTKFTADRLKELAVQYAGTDAKKIPIRVDSSGVGGGLADQRDDYNFIEINASNKAHNESKYPNKRSELLFTVADLMKHGQIDFSRLAQSQFTELKRQALGITYKLDYKGRRVAERKDDIKKRIGRSPDDLDAIALAYCGRSHLADLTEAFEKFTQHNLTAQEYAQRVAEEKNNIQQEQTPMAAAAVFDDYKEVFLVRTFGTYQARPQIKGREVPLGDYQTQHEAAYSVEYAHHLLGTQSPHTVKKGKVDESRLKLVEDDTEKRLKQRGFLKEKKVKE